MAEFLVVEVPRPLPHELARIVAEQRAAGYTLRASPDVRAGRASLPRIAFLVFVRTPDVQ